MSYQAGAFCWVDLITPDLGKAFEFYGGLFAWSAAEVSDGGHPYTMFRLGEGKVVAGVGQMSAEMKAGGVPSVWNTYVAVDDIDAVAERVSDLGGAVLFPKQAGGAEGFLAFFTDPSGATFAVWQAREGAHDAVRDVNGGCTWNELASRDMDASRVFYGELFGWRFETGELAPGMDYTRIRTATGSKDIGGMLAMTEEWGDAPPHWMTYFQVADADATVAAAAGAGGNICVPPFDMPSGRMAVIDDNQGATFSILART